MRVMVFVKATEDRHKMCSKCAGMFWNARSIQLHASLREAHFPEVRLAVFPQDAAYRRQVLDRHGYEGGI